MYMYHLERLRPTPTLTQCASVPTGSNDNRNARTRLRSKLEIKNRSSKIHQHSLLPVSESAHTCTSCSFIHTPLHRSCLPSSQPRPKYRFNERSSGNKKRALPWKQPHICVTHVAERTSTTINVALSQIRSNTARETDHTWVLFI